MVACITELFLLLAAFAATASMGDPECNSLGHESQQVDYHQLDEEAPSTVALFQGLTVLHLGRQLQDGANLLQTLVEPTIAGLEDGDNGRNSNSNPSFLWIHVPRSSSRFFLSLLERQNSSSSNSSSGSKSGDSSGSNWQTGQPAGDNASFAPNPAMGDAHPGPLDAAVWNTFRGSLAAMFRRPTERMHSSWAWHAAAANSTTSADVTQPRIYARQVTGLTTKVLAGQWMGEGCSSKEDECVHRESPKLALALSRLDGFKFVGLTEEHSLSICLFHAMFGGECQPSDFEPTQRGSYEHSTPEIARFFRSFIDPYDEAIHQKASSIFWKNVRSHNVSLQTCRNSICPRAATFFSS